MKTITRILSNDENVENVNIVNVPPKLKSTTEAPTTPKRSFPVNFSTPRPPSHRVSVTFSENLSLDSNSLYSFLFIFKGVPVANARHRRSKSTDERWLEHRSAHPVPLGTIMQPQYKNRKSFTKPDAKEIINSKSAKYCLVAQTADTDGELETCLYKGNVIPTAAGGAQVIFDDVECLKQKSPVSVSISSAQKRGSDDYQMNEEEVANRCSVGIQNSKKAKI